MLVFIAVVLEVYRTNDEVFISLFSTDITRNGKEMYKNALYKCRVVVLPILGPVYMEVGDLSYVR